MVDDDRQRPAWVGDDPLMRWYHDAIWGRRTTDDGALFENMCLQVFQAGLSWRMILLRRDAFRAAFSHWRIDAVAALDQDDIARLLEDASIVRNRRKIEACIRNAAVAQQLQREHGSFCRWFYERLPGDELAPLQKTLRATFRFMGPEIARMWLLSSGRLQGDA